jgi:hypothetical protein
MLTITPVKVIADLLNFNEKTSTFDKFDGILPLTISIEEGVITLGSLNGPDLWRAKLEELTCKLDT